MYVLLRECYVQNLDGFEIASCTELNVPALQFRPSVERLVTQREDAVKNFILQRHNFNRRSVVVPAAIGCPSGAL